MGGGAAHPVPCPYPGGVSPRRPSKRSPRRAAVDAAGADDSPVVLGVEYARAAEADRRWREARGGRAASPIGDTYDFWKGEHDLLRFTPCGLDDHIAAVVGRYREAGSAERARLHDAVSLEDCYTLLAFARRAAVRALRSGDPAAAEDGLVAVAMVEPERIDRRDLAAPVGLLCWALDRLGADPAEALGRTAPLATAEARPYLEGFGDPLRLSDWGFALVDTPDGPGLANAGIDRLAPTVGLVPMGIATADAVNADLYRVASLTIGSDLPAVWVGATPRAPERARTLGRARAGLSVDGRLRPEMSAESEWQQLTVFLTEAWDHEDAGRIAGWARRRRGALGHVGLALTHGPVACVLVARSTLEGAARYESPESIERFRAPLAAAIGGPPAPGG